jgi:hypothetical protein
VDGAVFVGIELFEGDEICEVAVDISVLWRSHAGKDKLGSALGLEEECWSLVREHEADGSRENIGGMNGMLSHIQSQGRYQYEGMWSGAGMYAKGKRSLKVV